MIDFVLIWVDGNDPSWIKEYNKFHPEDQKITDPNSEARSRDMDLLKYIFRGFENYTPWVRKIHFITFGHKPEWLNVDHPKINFLTHNDIFLNKEHLPTFSSTSIELNFAGIKNLADKFVYINDDMLILQKIEKKVFFTGDLPNDYLLEDFPRFVWLHKLLKDDWEWVAYNKNDIKCANDIFNKYALLKKNYKKYISPSYALSQNLKNILLGLSPKFLWPKINHLHQPLLKKNILKVVKNHKYLVEMTSLKKDRSMTDLDAFIYRYYHLFSGEFNPRLPDTNDIFYSPNDASKETQAKVIDILQRGRLVCLNDTYALDVDNFLVIKKIILEQLELKFPNKSSFEKEVN